MQLRRGPEGSGYSVGSGSPTGVLSTEYGDGWREASPGSLPAGSGNPDAAVPGGTVSGCRVLSCVTSWGWSLGVPCGRGPDMAGGCPFRGGRYGRVVRGATTIGARVSVST